jgi:hypothetical protein
MAETRGSLGEGALAVKRETKSSIKGSLVRGLGPLRQTIKGSSDGTTAAKSEGGRAESWKIVAVSSVSFGRRDSEDMAVVDKSNQFGPALPAQPIQSASRKWLCDVIQFLGLASVAMNFATSIFDGLRIEPFSKGLGRRYFAIFYKRNKDSEAWVKERAAPTRNRSPLQLLGNSCLFPRETALPALQHGLDKFGSDIPCSTSAPEHFLRYLR